MTNNGAVQDDMDQNGATGTGLIHEPLEVTPPRRRRSVRRTSNIDIVHLDNGGLEMNGQARDLLTGADGEPVVLGEAALSAAIGPDRKLATISATPLTAATNQLVGALVGPGFRASLAGAVPEEMANTTPLYLLLDELPVAALISGFALLYSGAIPANPDVPFKENVCSGWRSDGTMMVSIRSGNGVPVPLGPPTNKVEPADDDWSWHSFGPLARGAMRRRRAVEIDDDGGAPVIWAWFRDTFVNAEGEETVLHEYQVDATLDLKAGTFTSCVATPKVLPWTECPAAAASAGDLTGQRFDEVRDVVRKDFRGTSTCTHLNDLLRSLGDVSGLLGHL